MLLFILFFVSWTDKKSGKIETEFWDGVNSESLIWNATISVFSVIDIPTFFLRKQNYKALIYFFVVVFMSCKSVWIYGILWFCARPGEGYIYFALDPDMLIKILSISTTSWSCRSKSSSPLQRFLLVFDKHKNDLCVCIQTCPCLWLSEHQISILIPIFECHDLSTYILIFFTPFYHLTSELA